MSNALRFPAKTVPQGFSYDAARSLFLRRTFYSSGEATSPDEMSCRTLPKVRSDALRAFLAGTKYENITADKFCPRALFMLENGRGVELAAFKTTYIGYFNVQGGNGGQSEIGGFVEITSIVEEGCHISPDSLITGASVLRGKTEVLAITQVSDSTVSDSRLFGCIVDDFSKLRHVRASFSHVNGSDLLYTHSVNSTFYSAHANICDSKKSDLYNGSSATCAAILRCRINGQDVSEGVYVENRRIRVIDHSITQDDLKPMLARWIGRVRPDKLNPN